MARGEFNNVSEVLGRRERRPPIRYDEYQQWFDSPPRAKASRGRGNNGGAGSRGFHSNRGQSEGKHSYNRSVNSDFHSERINNRSVNSDFHRDRLNTSGIFSESEDENDQDDEERFEELTRIGDNTARINSLREDFIVVLRYIIKTLTDEQVNIIARMCKKTKSVDHELIKDLMRFELNERASDEQGKDVDLIRFKTPMTTCKAGGSHTGAVSRQASYAAGAGAAADAGAGAGTAAGAAAHPGVPTERTYASIMTEDQPQGRIQGGFYGYFRTQHLF